MSDELKYPASADEWSAALKQAGLSNGAPANVWAMQESPVNYSAENYRRMGEQFAEAMRRKFPVDLTISTTCARCSATIDPAAVEQHHERCFRVGDRVRWTSPIGDERWAEGEVLHVDCIAVSLRISTVSVQWLDRRPVEGTFVTVNRDLIRHIQRPGQAELKTAADQINERIKRLNEMRMEHLASKMPKRDPELQDAMEAMEEFTPILPPEVDPLDVAYDGIKLRVLIRIDEDSRREIRTARNWGHEWTQPQREAVSAYHSAALRARISAAKERERLSVRIEQDVEDEPW